MKRELIRIAIVFAVVLGTTRAVFAQAEPKSDLPLPTAQEMKKAPIPEAADYPPYRGIAMNVMGAHQLPDPKLTYKVAFDIGSAPNNTSEVNPGLITASRFLNTLAKYGVPASHRKIVVVFHREGASAILTNEAFKKRNNGQDNPNIRLMEAMQRAGVQFHVCGQTTLLMHIDPKEIQPFVETDLWAAVTFANLGLQGFQRLGSAP